MEKGGACTELCRRQCVYNSCGLGLVEGKLGVKAAHDRMTGQELSECKWAPQAPARKAQRSLHAQSRQVPWSPWKGSASQHYTVTVRSAAGGKQLNLSTVVHLRCCWNTLVPSQQLLAYKCQVPVSCTASAAQNSARAGGFCTCVIVHSF